MARITLTFTLGPSSATGVRGIGFLEGHSELDVGATFPCFADVVARQFRARIDYWLAGNDKPSKWFHGFTSDAEYRECFVFKYNQHRLYGYLCNPRPLSNNRFRCCVLCVYATKNERETDKSELKRVEGWRTSPMAREAISVVFPEFKEEAKWRN